MSYRLMDLEMPAPLPEECLKRIPPALIRELTEIVGPVEYPRPATPSIDFLDFPEN